MFFLSPGNYEKNPYSIAATSCVSQRIWLQTATIYPKL